MATSLQATYWPYTPSPTCHPTTTATNTHKSNWYFSLGYFYFSIVSFPCFHLLSIFLRQKMWARFNPYTISCVLLLNGLVTMNWFLHILKTLVKIFMLPLSPCTFLLWYWKGNGVICFQTICFWKGRLVGWSFTFTFTLVRFCKILKKLIYSKNVYINYFISIKCA